MFNRSLQISTRYLQISTRSPQISTWSSQVRLLSPASRICPQPLCSVSAPSLKICAAFVLKDLHTSSWCGFGQQHIPIWPSQQPQKSTMGPQPAISLLKQIRSVITTIYLLRATGSLRVLLWFKTHLKFESESVLSHQDAWIFPQRFELKFSILN